MNLNIIKVIQMYLNYKNVDKNGSDYLVNDYAYKQSLEDAQNSATNEKEIRNIYVILFLVTSEIILPNKDWFFLFIVCCPCPLQNKFVESNDPGKKSC